MIAIHSTDFEEKRKHPRFNVEIGSFAVFRNDPAVIPGLIVDLSMGGLAFLYPEGEDWPENVAEKVILFGDDFCVEEVRMKTVMDLVVDPEKIPAAFPLLQLKAEGRKIHRRGVEFVAMPTHQKKKLKRFIEMFQDHLARSQPG